MLPNGFTLVSRNSASGAVTIPTLVASADIGGQPEHAEHVIRRDVARPAEPPIAAERDQEFRASGTPSGNSEHLPTARERRLQIDPWPALTKVTQPEISQSEIAEAKVSQPEVAESEVAQAKIAQPEIAETEIAQAHVERQRAADSGAHDVAPAADLPQVDVRPVVESRERSIGGRWRGSGRDWDLD